MIDNLVPRVLPAKTHILPVRKYSLPLKNYSLLAKSYSLLAKKRNLDLPGVNSDDATSRPVLASLGLCLLGRFYLDVLRIRSGHHVVTTDGHL
jgi:hypothetical protein